MKKLFFLQLLVIIILLSYPLIYSMLYQKNKIAVYENSKIYVADSGVIAKWIVEIDNKPVYFIRALSFRIFEGNFIYLIFDRHSVSDDIIEPYFKANLKNGFKTGVYNYVIFVAYKDNKATVLINNKKLNVNLINPT